MSERLLTDEEIQRGLDKRNCLGVKVLSDSFTPIQVKALLQDQRDLTCKATLKAVGKLLEKHYSTIKYAGTDICGYDYAYLTTVLEAFKRGKMPSTEEKT